MDVLNIYSQRLGKNMPPRLATRLQAPETDTCASQTELSCPPSKSVSLQTKLGLKTSASQTDLPSPKPPSKEILSLVVATQTDIVASTKNDNLEASNAPLTGGSRPQQQAVSKPKEVETAVSAPPSGGPTAMAQSPPASKPSPMQVPGGTSGGKESLSSELEEQKKRELIATLKAMDAQKDPPASQPITSTATKSTAQPTSNVLVGGERPSVGKLTNQSTQPPTTSQPVKIDNDEEAKKKKLLLAKLMAIDEGNDPNKVTVSKTDVSKAQLAPAKHPASGRQSSTSIQSWPETVENMYQGKPAFATDDDPFGSRHSSGKKGTAIKSRDFFLTEGGGEMENAGSNPKNRRFGRRHQLEQKKSSTLDFSADNNSSMKADGGRGDNKVVTKAAEKESSPVAPTAQLGYQPTFGRRAGAAAAQTSKQKPKNGMIFGDLDRVEPTVAAKRKTEPPSSLEFNFEASESVNKASTDRDYPWENRVNVSSIPQGTTGGRERPRGEEKERRESVKSDGGPLSSPSMVFGYVGQEKPLHALQSRSRGSLLPLREKAVLGSVMPAGTLDIAEPDDLEELAL